MGARPGMRETIIYSKQLSSGNPKQICIMAILHEIGLTDDLWEKTNTDIASNNSISILFRRGEWHGLIPTNTILEFSISMRKAFQSIHPNHAWESKLQAEGIEQSNGT